MPGQRQLHDEAVDFGVVVQLPHLAAILVGHDGGSETYVRNKVLACERVGFGSTLLRFEDDISEADLLAQVRQLNDDPEIDGF
ncbi:MAG: hypothetical protein EOO36_24580, partial [Cytophagaceae bacterium]